MEDLKTFDGREPFVRPEKPFLLIYKNYDLDLRVIWFETEENLIDQIIKIKANDCKIVCAIEIGSCRDIDIE